MTNWVDTAMNTVARSWASIRSVSLTLNRGSTTLGAPSSVGVKCAVHSPKPNGAGTTLMQMSSVVSSPASTA